MTTTSDLLEMGQDLSILSDELRDGSQALANLQADIEDISMFGKDKNNTTYADININKLKEPISQLQQSNQINRIGN